MQAKIETIPISRHARVAPITEEPDEHSTTHDAAVPAMANVVAAAARKEPPTPRLDRQKTLGRLTKSLFGGGEGRARWSIMRAANKSSRSAALEAEDAARRAAAALIQKRFRDQTFLHRDVGPTVMCLKGGARALWGSINFGRARQSSFLACSDTTSAPLIAHIFQLHWSLPTPEMILSVTGGAQDFELTPRLQSLFTNGLTHVAGRSNVWIITGGTDSGVMKLVGNAMASVGHKNPIIGIAPYMATNGRDLLNGCHGDTVKYGGVAPAGRQGAPLNPNHSHFLLVDAGTQRSPFGTEIGLRNELESYFRKTKRTPLVLLVVQGGPGTMTTVAATAKAGDPVVILVDSGGAATAIAAYCEGGGSLDAVRETVGEKFADEKKAAQLQQIYELHKASGNTLLTFFSIDSVDADLSASLLDAIIKVHTAGADKESLAGGTAVGGRAELGVDATAVTSSAGFTSPRAEVSERSSHAEASQSNGRERRAVASHSVAVRMLMLAVNWNLPENASRIIGRLGTGVGYRVAVKEALQRALFLQRKEMVELLLDLPGVDIAGIRMVHLYTVSDSNNVLRNDQALQARMAGEGGHIFDQRAALHKQQQALYCRVVGPFLDSLAPSGTSLQALALLSGRVDMSDLFCWSTIVGNEELAFALWPRCEKPLHVAIIGASICSKLAERVILGKSDLRDRASRMGSWAIGALEMAPDEAVAFHILDLSLIPDTELSSRATQHGGPRQTLLDLAMCSNFKPLLALGHAQKLMDAWWRGGDSANTETVLPEQFSWLLLCLKLFLPIFNPALHCNVFALWRRIRSWRSESQLKKKKAKEEEESSSTAVFSMAISLQVAMREWRNARKVAAAPGDAPASARSSLLAQPTAEEVAAIHKRVDSLSKDIETFRNQRIATGEITSGQESKSKVRGRKTVSLKRFYTTQAVVFLMRFLAHAIFLIVIFLLVVYFKEWRFKDIDFDKRMTFLEYLWFIFQLGWLLDYVQQNVVARRIGFELQSEGRIWLYMRWISFLCCLLATGLRVASLNLDMKQDAEAQSVLLDYVHILISVNGLFLVLSTLPMIAIFSGRLDTLVLIIENMLSDISLWLVVQAVLIMGFIILFYGLGSVGSYQNPVNPKYGDMFDPALGVFSIPFMVTFGELPTDGMVTWEASMSLYAYGFISSIALVNLLIAMFSDTYSRCLIESRDEHAFTKCTRLYIQRHIALTIPPPFNLPFALRDILCQVGTTRFLGFQVKKQLTPAVAMKTMRKISREAIREANSWGSWGAEKIDSLISDKEDDQPKTVDWSDERNPRDGAVLVDAFVRKKANEEEEERKRESEHLDVLRRLDAISTRLGRVEAAPETAPKPKASPRGVQLPRRGPTIPPLMPPATAPPSHRQAPNMMGRSSSSGVRQHLQSGL